MCKNSKVIMLGRDYEASRAHFSRPDCRVWGCEDCAKAMAYDHKRRIAEGIRVIGGVWWFITITAHENAKNATSCLKNLDGGMRKLFERLRRAHGTKHYIITHEFHENGRIHIHMLYQCDSPFWAYVYAPLRKKEQPLKRLKDITRECGMGYMCDVRKVDDREKAVGYVAKYISKSMSETNLPIRFKRVRFSVRFPKVERVESNMVWSTIESDRLVVRAKKSELIDNNWNVSHNFRIEELSSIYDIFDNLS
jgi:hypothetical protein